MKIHPAEAPSLLKAIREELDRLRESTRRVGDVVLLFPHGQ